MDEKFVTFYQNPKVDVLFGFVGRGPIPTKQDKFKPVEANLINEDGSEEVLKNVYLKKPDASSILEFHNYLQEIARQQISTSQRINRPNDVEVILSIAITESRYKTVDIDNLAKAVLDSLNGIAYEDDSQVASLICKKYVYKHNGIMIGVTKLTHNNRGLGESIKLQSETPW